MPKPKIIQMFGIVGSQITENSLNNDLPSDPKADIVIEVNSRGGNYFTGVAIYNLLLKREGKITVDVVGLAASAAATITMAGSPKAKKGNEIIMRTASRFMIHKPSTITAGNSEDVEKTARDLKALDADVEQIFTKGMGQTSQKIRDLMDSEKLISPKDAEKMGWARSAPSESKQLKNYGLSVTEDGYQAVPAFFMELPETYDPAQIKGDTVFTTEPSEWISVTTAEKPEELLAKCTNKTVVNVNALRAILTIPKWANQELVTRSLNEFKRQQLESGTGLLPSTIDAMPIAIRVGGDTHLIQRKDLAMTQEIVTVLGVENYEEALEKAKQLIAAGGTIETTLVSTPDQSEVLKRMENAITSLTKQIKDMSDTQIEAGKASMEAELEALYVGGYFNEAQRKSLTALFDLSPEAYRVSVDALKLGGVNPKLAELRNAEGSGGDGEELPATKEKDPVKRLQAKLLEIEKEMGDKYTTTAGYERIKKDDPKLLEEYTKATTSVAAPQS